MAATPSGKDKIELYTRLYIGGYDISGDARTFGSAENTMEGVSMRGWANSVDQFIADGWRMIGLRGFKAFMNDTSTTGAFTLLRDRPSNELILAFGGGGEPAVPDPCYIMSGVQINSPVTMESSAAILTADFVANSNISTHGNPFGVVLSPPTSISSTTSNSSHDNGAATTGGYHTIIEVLAASGTWDVTIEHSTDDSSWSTLATFTTITTISDEHIAGTGTVNRYVRAKLTRTSGAITAVIGFARN